MKRKWVVAQRQHDDLIQHLLLLHSVEAPENFFNPRYSDRSLPERLPNMASAVERIKYAIDHNQTIGIYGDYDCDGIPGTALLSRALKMIGVEVKVYIPRREVGYGLNRRGIDQLKSESVDLLITVDNGTTATEEVEYARGLNIDVLITDHHEPHSTVPKAIVVNPKLQESQHPVNDLCGTAVAFKLIEGLSVHYPDLLNERVLKWQLDLVALATICDMVELTGENRLLTTFGLTVLRQTKNVGLRALFNVAGIDPKTLTASAVGFGLGPRINAAGRMEEDPMLGFRLLTTNDVDEAATIAQTLHRLNSERQDMLFEALRQAEIQLKYEAPAMAIVLQNPDWNAGIVGLIASKLLERYHKPAFIFDAKTGKGSARSIKGYPLPNMLAQLSEHFVSYGGHTMAGGMSLKKDAFLAFKKDLINHANSTIGEESITPHLYIDADVGLNEVNVAITKKLNEFEPFGVGNPKPLFVARNLTARDVKVMGSDQKHLRGLLLQSNAHIPFVAFGLAERKGELSNGQFDVVGRMELNHWNGHTTAEMHVVDVDNSRQ